MLAGLGALLAVTVAAEGWMGLRAPRDAAAHGPASVLPPPGVRRAAVLPPDRQEQTRIILGRPLFTPGRRPPSEAASGPAEPRLAGIVISPGGRKAIFAGDGDARAQVVAPGGNAGVWHIVAIGDGAVQVIGPDGPRTLRPTRDGTTSSGVASGTAFAPSGASGFGAGGPAGDRPSILDLIRRRLPPGTTPTSLPNLLPRNPR